MELTLFYTEWHEREGPMPKSKKVLDRAEEVPPQSKEEIKDSLAFAQAYYVHQFQRRSAIEQQEMAMSQIVMGITTLAFTFGISDVQELNLMNGICLPIIVISINAFAIFCYYQMGKFIRVYRSRAKRVLEIYAASIYKIDQETQWSGHSLDWKFYSSVHIFMILVALLPIFLYLRGVH